ncbi:hypothetical protein [Mycoplasma nasistruthionis]|uniref:Glucose-6-phosphate isomerase n=1 Tax=Mycoplasma nasistruthionis TaxID=353852 RepID=A0A5B7XUV9_9MOLU|nr:hypothetical protein [Mycoplasma nasistruthionis]QCZ36656.1 hypothetical protein FG904_01310 [Mycoplasma nasistruthionis]
MLKIKTKINSINLNLKKENVAKKLLSKFKNNKSIKSEIIQSMLNSESKTLESRLFQSYLLDYSYISGTMNMYIRDLIDKGIKTLYVIADDDSIMLIKMIYQFVFNPYSDRQNQIKLEFVSNNLTPEDIVYTLQDLPDNIFAINYISKSGLSVPGGIAFREIRKQLQDRIAKEKLDHVLIKKLIFITTFEKDGTLHKLASSNDYTMFMIKSELPTRYLQINEMILFPLLAAGVNCKQLQIGLVEMYKALQSKDPQFQGFFDILDYKMSLLNQDFLIEKIYYNDPEIDYLTGWCQTLSNQALNKNGSGLWTEISVVDKQNLANLYNNKYITTILLNSSLVSNQNALISVNEFDSLNFLNSKSKTNSWENNNSNLINYDLYDSNQIIFKQYDEQTLGQIIFFWQFLVIYLANNLLNDPFNQPGVDVYKRNFYTSLTK